MVFKELAPTFWHAGWRGILPLPAGQKAPIPRGYTGQRGQDPTLDQIKQWSVSHPDGNVALRLPTNMVGVDVDCYDKKRGDLTIQNAENEHGSLPKTWQITSRDPKISGIRLFSVPDGLRWKGEIGPDVDLVQRRHRFVVAPGSIHPKTGNTYRWYTPEGNVSTTPPNVDDISPLPDAWVKAYSLGPDLGTVSSELHEGEVESWLNAHGEGIPCSAVRHATKTGIEELEEGGRHDTALRVSARIISLAADGHEGAEQALEELRAEFLGHVEGDRQPGDAEREWARIVHGGVEKFSVDADASWGDPCREPFAGLIPPSPEGINTDTSVILDEHTSWWPKNLTAAITGEVLESNKPRYLLREDGKALLYPGQTNGFIGESESGKSFLAQMATYQAMSNGENVQYLDFEDNEFSVVERFKLMGASDTLLIERFSYVSPDEPLHEQAAEDLRLSLQQSKPAVVVLDGVNAAMTLMGLELESNSDATRFTQQLLKRLTAFGSTVITVDHVPKSKDNRGKGGIGAQAKRAMMSGAVFRVEIVKAFGRGMCGELKLTVDKDRPGYVRAISGDANYAGTVVIDSTVDSIKMFIRAPEGKQDVKESKTNATMKLVYDHVYANPGCSQTSIIEARPAWLSIGTVKAASEALVSAGFVSIKSGEHGTKLHSVTKKSWDFDGLVAD
jgi:hypothetical protein